MFPTSVGLFAPYGRGETTELALAIAAVLGQSDGKRPAVEVKYYAGDSKATNVHRWWDHHVIRKSPVTYADVASCDHRIWLTERPGPVTIPYGDNEIFVVPRVDTIDPYRAAFYAAYVVDDKATKRLLVKQCPGYKSYLRVIPWCSEPPERTTIPPMSQTILCLANAGAMKQDGLRLLHEIRKFLRHVPDASVRLVPLTTGVNKSLQQQAEACEEETYGRFQLTLRLSRADRRQFYASSDLVWLALRQPTSGLWLQEALEHGRPVVLAEDSLSDKLVKPGRNSCLLGEHWAKDLTELFRSHRWSRLLVDQDTRDGLSARRERFAAGWPKFLST